MLQYERQYKIKRKDNSNLRKHIKKRKIINDKKEINSYKSDVQHLNSSTSNFNNSEMNAPSVNVEHKNQKNQNVNNRILRIINNQDKDKRNDFITKKDSKSDDINLENNMIDNNVDLDIYRNDYLCRQLYKHIIKFIKEKDIKNHKESNNVIKILFDINNLFKN